MEEMKTKPPRFCLSPVDYEAWRNGYTPPSEHVLIDALHRGDAKVSASFSSKECGWWFVIRGAEGGISRKRAEAIRSLLNADLDFLVERFETFVAKEGDAALSEPQP